MIRTLKVNVDKASWPRSGKPAFPNGFHQGEKVSKINVSQVLLLLGHLTTPTVVSGVSLSEFWAWVRYYFALTQTPDLRLTDDFAELDPHQKTILSDDFGMAVPVWWLLEPLKLAAWCDGREFAARFAALTKTPVPKLNKHGPRKSPDFVFRDEKNLFHVVECKGTQSGMKARDRQLSHKPKGKQASGATVQKTMITLKSHLAGQRLACGLAIARNGSGYDSHLQIKDPTGGNIIEIKKGEEEYAVDAVVRASTARALRAVGLREAAAAMAAPSGRGPGARPLGDSQLERERNAFVRERLERAKTEIDVTLADDGIIETRDRKQRWVTRRAQIPLPKSLTDGEKVYRSVEVYQSVPTHLLERLRKKGLEEGLLAQTADWLPREVGRLTVASNDDEAELRLGTIFQSGIRFRR